MGKILKVDMSTGTLRRENLSEDVARRYLGGKGYATHLLYQYLKEYESKGLAPSEIDPLGPENVLIFATGPGTGVPGFPASGRYHVMALRSPLTGSVGSANSGGEWGPFLKFAGFDMIIIEGVSDTPIYLSIVNGEPEILDASGIWGKNVFDTCRILKRKVGGKNTSVACIGPAGENLARMACIVNDEHRAAGRTGLLGDDGNQRGDRPRAVPAQGVRHCDHGFPDAGHEWHRADPSASQPEAGGSHHPALGFRAAARFDRAGHRR
ncbi:MAG: aldehyde ferredoxin oxidoreductase N-terminal domain-containing protein [Candidatus Bathyarchaeia archaeon]